MHTEQSSNCTYVLMSLLVHVMCLYVLYLLMCACFTVCVYMFVCVCVRVHVPLYLSVWTGGVLVLKGLCPRTAIMDGERDTQMVDRGESDLHNK